MLLPYGPMLMKTKKKNKKKWENVLFFCFVFLKYSDLMSQGNSQNVKEILTLGTEIIATRTDGGRILT